MLKVSLAADGAVWAPCCHWQIKEEWEWALLRSIPRTGNQAAVGGPAQLMILSSWSTPLARVFENQQDEGYGRPMRQFAVEL
jgi:hypothetical protein